MLKSDGAIDNLRYMIGRLSNEYVIRLHGSFRFPVYPGWKSGLQVQEDMHILYVRGGEGRYTMEDGTVIPLRRGSLAFISDRYPYWSSHELDNPLVIHGLRFGLYRRDNERETFRAPSPFYCYVKVPDHRYYDTLTYHIHGLYHGDYEPDIKLTAAVSVQQILNELYLMLLRKNVGSEKSESKVHLAKQYIEERLDEKISIRDVADHVGMSVRYLQKLFKSEVGYSPKEYHLSAQMDKAHRDLEQSGLTVSQVAERLGYSDAFAFSHQFKKHFGFPPLAVINRSPKGGGGA